MVQPTVERGQMNIYIYGMGAQITINYQLLH
jgi:hypothetical protein